MRILGGLRSARTVVCGISGGVDSAVSALLLKNRGFNVIGLFMKNWDEKNEVGECLADKDREDAIYVCDHLNIPLHEVNFVKEYWNDVFSHFIKEYQTGRTPNPDVLCNKYIKFNAFLNHALTHLDADYIATGHYVRTNFGYELDKVRDNEYVHLLKAVDGKKDQTLFLSQIDQHGLRKALFPVGGLLKTQVKELARQNGMERVANRKESMGICFIGKRHFQEFISDYVEPKPGKFRHIETGEVVAEHNGIHSWTIGQRIHLAGQSKAFFVVSRNSDTQDIVVAPGTDHPALFTKSLYTELPHWISEPPKEFLETGKFDAGFRYQHVHLAEIQCTVQLEDKNRLHISLSMPLRAIVAGQYAVFYSGERCLGGAAISEVGPSFYDLNQTDRIQAPNGFT